MHEPSWKLVEHEAQLALPHVRAHANVQRPGEGLHQIVLNDQSLPGTILAPTLPCVDAPQAETIESYIRGGDCVAIYPPTPAHPFRSQAYWRVESHALMLGEHVALAAIELVASQQTDLLDSQPHTTVISRLNVQEVLSVRTIGTGGIDVVPHQRPCEFAKADSVGCFLFRLQGERYSYAEMVYPLDFQRTTLRPAEPSAPAGMIEIEHHLFAHRLEKGVILRARVLGLWLHRANDVDTMLLHYRQFAMSDPPLTT